MNVCKTCEFNDIELRPMDLPSPNDCGPALPVQVFFLFTGSKIVTLRDIYYVFRVLIYFRAKSSVNICNSLTKSCARINGI